MGKRKKGRVNRESANLRGGWAGAPWRTTRPDDASVTSTISITEILFPVSLSTFSLLEPVLRIQRIAQPVAQKVEGKQGGGKEARREEQ